MHFDWWMFPINDGRREEFHIHSEAEVQTLRHDREWLQARRFQKDYTQKSDHPGQNRYIHARDLSLFYVQFTLAFL